MVDADATARLRAVIGRLARQLNASATGAGLTPTQASVLGLVARHGEIGLAELATLEGVNPTMLSRVVGKLDELDLIRRTPDPTDQRAARAAITTSGKRLHQQLLDVRSRVVADCLDSLPAQTTHTLLAALPALEALADELRTRRG